MAVQKRVIPDLNAELTRFSSAKHLVGYAGLGTRIHAFGQVHRSGSITRTGRSELRTILVEAAWTTIRISPWWRARDLAAHRADTCSQSDCGHRSQTVGRDLARPRVSKRLTSSLI